MMVTMRVVALVLLGVSGASGSKARTIVDPSKFDSSLKACNSSAVGGGDASCGALRECVVDPNDGEQEVCLHKQLFPLRGLDVAGTLCLFCGLTLAASAGIGGGGLQGGTSVRSWPTSKAPSPVVFHSFRLTFRRASISRNGLEA